MRQRSKKIITAFNKATTNLDEVELRLYNIRKEHKKRIQALHATTTELYKAEAAFKIAQAAYEKAQDAYVQADSV